MAEPQTHSKFTRHPHGPPKHGPGADLSAAFNAASDRDRNLFYGMNAQAIAEFHATIGHDNNRGRLTKDEKTLLAEIRQQAPADVKRYGITTEVAESLLLAQKTTGVDHDAYMAKVFGPETAPSSPEPAVSDTAQKPGSIRIDLLSWLDLVKSHGKEHGLGYFADKIKSEPGPNGTTVLDVPDPATLRELAALRQNPRLAAIMAAEQLKHADEHHQVAYKDVNYNADEAVAKNQRNLRTLGFDIGLNGADGVRGPLTQAAEREFAASSKPAVFTPEALQAAADQALADSARIKQKFNVTVGPDQAFAIRQASKTGGADFDLMMKLAKRESNFDNTIKAQSNEVDSKKAVGLFQFKPGTWLAMVKRYGDKYGLGELADKIQATRGVEGSTNYTVADPWVRDHILNLRTDPRISATMGAELLKENRTVLEGALNRKPNETEEYMGHFMGAGGAASFLTQMKHAPNASAADAFPAAASTNPGVFYNADGSERSLTGVYQHFAATFDTRSYDNVPDKPAKPAAAHHKAGHHPAHTPKTAPQ